MKLFLDSSVVLAACGRKSGASRFIFDAAIQFGWVLQTSRYVVTEVQSNVKRLPAGATESWMQLSRQLFEVDDVISFHWPTILMPAKDRPVLFTAAACADVLLTLDRRDFQNLIGNAFYGLTILTPGDYLSREIALGRLVVH